MKKYILLSFTILNLFACNIKTDKNVQEVAESAQTTNLTQPKKEIETEKLATAEFKIDGMTCQMGCANTIQNKLEALNGVASAKVSFDNGNAIVSYDRTTLKVEDLKNTVNQIADGKLYKVVE